jgi:release factor glutamine methyltransferase
VSALTAGAALQWGADELASEAASRRDAELLLRAATGWQRTFVLTHEEAPLTPEAERTFRDMIARRAQGEPVQYITGEQEFWGLALKVTPAVLIPRPETEHLIEAVLAFASRDTELQIADVGTGSGAIAIALAKELPRAHILATDISEAALQIARENAARHNVAARIQFVHCDLLPEGLANRIDIVVSNPPYIPETDCDLPEGAEGALAREVKDFEPAQALFAGPTGYEVYSRLLLSSGNVLKAGGILVLELGAGQAKYVCEMLRGWTGVRVTRDLAGIERVVCAERV